MFEQFFYARLAQLGERIPYKDDAIGSNPILRTILTGIGTVG